MSLERSLRHLTYLCTAIAVPLNIASTALSVKHEHRYWRGRPVTAFCFVFVPLAMTIVTSTASLQYTRKHNKSPVGFHFKLLDLASALIYIAILIPIWTIELRRFGASGFGLLVGYTTAPMILNMLIHIYFTLNHIPWKRLFSTLSSKSSACQQCPNCQVKFIPSITGTMAKKGYSLLRGEDYLDVEADAVQYRDSEDFLGEGVERAEQAQETKQAEDSGKGKDTVDI